MKKQLSLLLMLILALTFVVIQSCKKDEDDNNNNNNNDPTVTDQTPPQVGVTSPTAEFSFLSLENTINLSGYASDNEAVSKVQWSSSSGAAGVASGTTSWAINGAALNNGDNLFTIIAFDGANNTDTAKILVTYNEFFNFNGELLVDPNGFYVNVATEVKVQVPVPANANIVAGSVKLIQVDQQGNMIQELTEMYDDGNLDHGDDILGDGVYSMLYEFLESSATRIYLRVKLTTTETSGDVDSYSGINEVSVVDQIPETAIQQILDVQSQGALKFEQLSAGNDHQEAVNQTITYVQSQNMVTNAGQTNSGDIWIEFDYGLSGMILTTEEGNEGGSSNGTQRASGVSIPVEKQTRGVNSPALFGSKEEVNMVLDNDALLYAPNWTQFNDWGTEFLDNVNTLLEDSECPNFNVSYTKNEDADLDVLRNLNNYGLIVIHTHGGVDKDGDVIFLTGDEVDYTPIEILEWILGNVMPIPHQGKSLWAVKPSFISMHNENYPNSIVYNGSCESAHNNTMADAFINDGANTYFGFSETVKSWFDRDMANQLFPELINNGKSVGEAFVPGQHDNNTPPAYFVMIGNEDTYFASDFVNGGFEEGSLAGWNVMGDGRVITQLGYIIPYAGSYMGVISTGLGYTVETGSLAQTFCVPDNATTLSLNWNFLSEEFMEWVGSNYQDYFQIEIIDENGASNVLFYKSIDDIANGYGLTLVSPAIVFDQGDVYGTDWQYSSFDISAFAGTGVTLIFSAGDVGDSIYDTAILLDEIKVE